MLRELVTRLIVPRHMRVAPQEARDLKHQMKGLEALVRRFTDERKSIADELLRRLDVNDEALRELRQEQEAQGVYAPQVRQLLTELEPIRKRLLKLESRTCDAYEQWQRERKQIDLHQTRLTKVESGVLQLKKAAADQPFWSGPVPFLRERGTGIHHAVKERHEGDNFVTSCGERHTAASAIYVLQRPGEEKNRCETCFGTDPAEIYHFASSTTGKVHRIREGTLRVYARDQDRFHLVCDCGTRLLGVPSERLYGGVIHDAYGADLCKSCFKE